MLAIFDSVIMPQGSRAMHRPVDGFPQGRRREHNIAVSKFPHFCDSA